MCLKLASQTNDNNTWTGEHHTKTQLRNLLDLNDVDMNLDHIMFSTDYPHTGCDWPNSRTVIERLFKGIPKDQVKQMLHDNCRALYRI